MPSERQFRVSYRLKVINITQSPPNGRIMILDVWDPNNESDVAG